MKKRYLFTIAAVLYILGIIVFVFHNFQEDRIIQDKTTSILLELANQRLQDYVGAEYHQRIFEQGPPSPISYFEKTLNLTTLAHEYEVDKCFTLILRENRFFYTASSSSQEALSQGKGRPFLTPFPEAPSPLQQLLNQKEELITQYETEEGSFLALFTPRKTPQGHQYITASAILFRNLHSGTKKNILEALLLLGYLLAISLPLLFIYIKGNKKEKKQLLERIYRDQMTGLPNRNKLRIDTEKTAHPILLLMNIDSFKEYNDFYGFKIGDFIILEMASRLRLLLKYTQEKIKDNTTLYKMQVDEYALLINTPLTVTDVEELAFKMSQVINDEPFIYRKQEIPVNATIGIALGRQGAKPVLTQDRTPNILARADMALKKAKISRRHYLIYDESMHIQREYESNIRWTQELKNSIKNERVVPFFQPIVNNSNGQIEKYETLIRIKDEEGSIIYPSSFLQISKRSRLYPQLTRIMIRHTLELIQKYPYTFSINFSVEDILNQETRTFLFQMLRGYPEEANNLVIELVESEGIENFEEVRHFIDESKRLGCLIAIDDFGTGYSNFSYLVKLKVDFIKIDASMIKNIHQDENARIITETIVGFCKKMNIKTIAEFVHNQEVQQVVKELGIDYSQGYYFGKPVDTI